MSDISDVSRSELTENISLKSIPFPEEIIREYRGFFGDSDNLDGYKVISDLDQFDNISIWRNSRSRMDETDRSVILEKPVGMKTLDHYFQKRILNKDQVNDPRSKGNLVKESKRNSQSPLKKVDETLSQDIFDNDSQSSNEYSLQNDQVLTNVEVVPCTQLDEPVVSKFNTSNLIHSGSTRNKGSDSDSSKNSSDTSTKSSTVFKMKSSKERKNDEVPSSSVKVSRYSSESSRSVKTDKTKDRNSSLSDDNTVSNRTNSLKSNPSKEDRRMSSLSDTSKSLSNTSTNINKSTNKDEDKRLSFRSKEKSNTSLKLDKSKRNDTSSSSDNEDESPSRNNTSLSRNSKDGNDRLSSSSRKRSITSDKINTSNDEHRDKSYSSGGNEPTSKFLNRSSKSNNDSFASSSDKETKSASKAQIQSNTSLKSNKSMNEGSSRNSSSSDEETKSASKSRLQHNTSLNMSKSMNKGSSGCSSSSDEETNSASKPQVQSNTPVKLNKSINKGSSGSSSSSDEETQSASKTPVNTSLKLNKSMNKGSSGSSSSSDEETESASKPQVQKNTSLKLNKLMNKKSSGSSSSIDDEEQSTSKPQVQSNTSLKSNKFMNKESSGNSSSSDEEAQSALKTPVNTSLKSNKSMKNSSSSSSDEESKLPTHINTSMKLNKIDDKYRNKDDKSDFDNSVHKNMKVSSNKNSKRSESKNISKKHSSSVSSSDEGELSFKNREIGKMLGLNSIGSARNMSCSGNKVLSNQNQPLNDSVGKVLPKKSNNVSCSEDSESDSSDSGDEKAMSKKEIPTKNILGKEESTFFSPSASSSFMMNTPEALPENRMKMPPINSVRRKPDDNVHIKGNKHRDKDSSNSENEVSKKKNKSELKEIKRKLSDSHEDKSILSQNKIDRSGSLKRKHTYSDDSDHTAKKKLKTKENMVSNMEMDVDTNELQSEEEVISEKKLVKEGNPKRPGWLEEIAKNMTEIRAEDKLRIESCICLEDITSDDEIYSLQCPKELNINSLMKKMISLTGESLFEGETVDKRSVAYETFAVNLPSKINLLLPSKRDSTFKLGGFDVKGSIIISERCIVPEVDISTFSSTGKESSSDDEQLNKSTPLPSGLKLRHPLHGLDYKKTALPNFDAVIAREKKRNKKKKRDHGDKEMVDSMIGALLAKKKLSLEGTSEGFKKPLAPVPISKNSGSSILSDDSGSNKGVVIGRNLISLVSDDEGGLISKEEQRKQKKKMKLDNAKMQVTRQCSQDSGQNEELQQTEKKKKSKKDKLMDQMIREVQSSVGVSSNVDPSLEGLASKKKKKKKDKEEPEQVVFHNQVQSSLGVSSSRDPSKSEEHVPKKKKKKDKRELEQPSEHFNVAVDNIQSEVKRKKKKKKERDMD